MVTKRRLPKMTKSELIDEVKGALTALHKNDSAAIISYLLGQFTAWDLETMSAQLFIDLKARSDRKYVKGPRGGTGGGRQA